MEEVKNNGEAAEKQLNFIEEIIENDLASGRCTSVLTRFPPEPNGYLHIGHAKSICLNFGLAKKYGGKTNIRFDDTNPTKEDVEYVDSIKEDVKWLGFEWANEFYASDYFDKMYEQDPEKAFNVLLNLYARSSDSRTKNIRIGILHILSHKPYDNLIDQIGVVIARQGLEDVDVEVIDYAIKCFDNWQNKDCIQYLQNVDYPTSWLKDYAYQVIKDLSEGC